MNHSNTLRDATHERANVSCPPLVIRGAKCQVTGRIDWWAGTRADLQGLGNLTLQLTDRFGPYRTEKGRNFYAERREFNNGTTINYTPDGMCGNKGMMLELPGGSLGELAWAEVLELLRLITPRLRCSRLDLALDYRGDAVPLIGLARESALRGELCRCRRWKPVDEYLDVERTAYGVNFGKRGKDGSGKYMRWYDKGLEANEEPEGRWVRLEAELSGGVAQAASQQVLESTEPVTVLAGITLACVDFRANTGDAHLERRPRMAWWDEVLASIAVIRITAPRKRKTLESYGAWLNRCVFKGLSDCAILTGMTVQEVMKDLHSSELMPLPKPPELNPVAWAYAENLKMFNHAS